MDNRNLRKNEPMGKMNQWKSEFCGPGTLETRKTSNVFENKKNSANKWILNIYFNIGLISLDLFKLH